MWVRARVMIAIAIAIALVNTFVPEARFQTKCEKGSKS